MRKRCSLRLKLTIACVLLTVALCFFLYLILYRNTTETLRAQQIENVTYEMKNLSDKLDLELSSVKSMLYYNSNEKAVQRLLAAKDPRYLSIQLYQELNDRLQTTDLYEYTNKLIVASPERILITAGNMEGMPGDFGKLQALPDLAEVLESDRLGEIGIIDGAFYYFENPYQCIPVGRRLYNSRRQEVGFVYMSLSTKILTDKINDFSSLDQSLLYVKINGNYYQLDGDTFYPIAGEIKVDGAPSAGTKKVTAEAEGRSYDAVVSAMSHADWAFIQLIDPEFPPISFNIPSYFWSLLGIVLTFALLSLITTRWVSQPVRRISRQIVRVSENDLALPSEVEGSSSEFYIISSGIEQMREKLNVSLQEQLQMERDKKDLEFKVLQYQINPHFICNSLNIIKWMADIQESPGISEIAVSLSNLYQSVIRNDARFVTLRQELSVLDDYVTIQRYRYEDIFTYEAVIEDPTLLDTEIMKFTFQPLVENAIIHGIASKRSFGKIRLTVRREGSDIVAELYDNGTGMSRDQIHAVFCEEAADGGALNKIGVQNVARRLKYEYGGQYGITIESEPGEYTLVVLRYPDRREGGADV